MSESLIVCVGAGHGGASTGVVMGNEGSDRLTEKTWTLEFALALHDHLGHLPGIQAPLTRHEDKDLGLTEEALLAKEYGADLVLSLHVNSYKDPHEHGLRAFHMPGDRDAKAIADTIALHAPMQLREFTPRARTASDLWPAVRNVLTPFQQRGICAVLIEFGFASNTADRRYLLSEPGKAACANAAEAGVIEFMRLRSTKYAA